MTEEQWGLFTTGILIGVVFCGAAAAGAVWMFYTLMKLEGCGFRIQAWRVAMTAARPKAVELDVRHRRTTQVGL